jgi:hypothetical protein
MKETKVTMTVYTYNELTERAKSTACEDYIDAIGYPAYYDSLADTLDSILLASDIDVAAYYGLEQLTPSELGLTVTKYDFDLFCADDKFTFTQIELLVSYELKKKLLEPVLKSELYDKGLVPEDYPICDLLSFIDIECTYRKGSRYICDSTVYVNGVTSGITDAATDTLIGLSYSFNRAVDKFILWKFIMPLTKQIQQHWNEVELQREADCALTNNDNGVLLFDFDGNFIKVDED